jgi:altronate dehydratase
LGLGCEVNQVDFIARDYKQKRIRAGEARPTFLNIQTAGGIAKTVDAAAARRWRGCCRPPTSTGARPSRSAS